MGQLKLKCMYHHVLVRTDKPETTTHFGLIIPDSVLDDQSRHTGTVEHCGHGILDKDGTLRPLMVKVGDRVLFGKYAGLKIIINGIEYKHMREDEIIAIIEEMGDGIKIEDAEY